MSKYEDLLNQCRDDGSIITNKNLVFSIGRYPAEIFTELLSLQEFYYEVDKLTEDGYFYCTINRMYLNTGLKKDAQNTAINTLVDKGLIKKEKRGLPPKRHFKVIATKKQLQKYIEQGKEIIEKERERLEVKNEKDKERYFKNRDKSAKNPDNSKNEDLPKDYHREDRRTNIEQSTVNNTKFNNTKNNTKNNKGVKQVYTYQQFKNEYNQDIYENIDLAIQYYLNRYEEIFNKEHPNMKYEQWDNVVWEMISIKDSEYDRERYDIEFDRWKEIIDKHFNTRYRNCDYHLPHFISGKIIKNRFHEIGGVF